jgi:hypothetical protein
LAPTIAEWLWSITVPCSDVVPVCARVERDKATTKSADRARRTAEGKLLNTCSLQEKFREPGIRPDKANLMPNIDFAGTVERKDLLNSKES